MTLGLRPLVSAVTAVLIVTVALVVVVRRNTALQIEQLRLNGANLHLENASYRSATGELTSQIVALEAAIADLGERATLDPATVEAINNLPAVVKSTAMGGAAAELTTRWLSGEESPESTFDVLRDLLETLEGRLRYVRTDVERRQVLAEATPSIWPARGWLSAGYGRRKDPFTGHLSFHPAIDVSADRGQPIYATAHGTVQSAKYSGAYGNLVTLKHGFGLRTRYGHMSRFAVKAGDTVQRGDIIGYVGRTGRATGDHVHYEVWVKGKPINPLRLLMSPTSRRNSG